jgi:cell division protein FtsN
MKSFLKSDVSQIGKKVSCVCITLSLIGCVSSEETGANARAAKPVQTLGQIDTSRIDANQELPEPSIDTQQKVAPKFKSKEDTLQVAVITKSKSSAGPHAKIEQMGQSVYTVQIGAYNSASHALRRQKKAKEQFAGQPVFNKYEESTKLYRVSIGMYQDEKDATALSDSLKQKYPDEYKQCWINFIP